MRGYEYQPRRTEVFPFFCNFEELSNREIGKITPDEDEEMNQ